MEEISAILRQAIDRQIEGLHDDTRDYLEPAITNGLKVIEHACPVGMRPTSRGMRMLYGPYMGGGRYAMSLSNPDTAVFLTYTELPDRDFSPEAMAADIPRRALWGFIDRLLTEGNSDDALVTVVLMLRRDRNMEKVKSECDKMITEGNVPCLFVACRASDVSPVRRKSAGFICVLPLPPSIERQDSVADLGA